MLNCCERFRASAFLRYIYIYYSYYFSFLQSFYWFWEVDFVVYRVLRSLSIDFFSYQFYIFRRRIWLSLRTIVSKSYFYLSENVESFFWVLKKFNELSDPPWTYFALLLFNLPSGLICNAELFNSSISLFFSATNA